MDYDISCPSCGRADWVQSIPALRSSGVSTLSGTDYHAGVGISSAGLVPVVGTTTIERTQTTALAQAIAYAPREVSPTRPLLLGCLLTVPALGVLYPTIDNIVTHPSLDNITPITWIINAAFSIAIQLVATAPAIGAFAFSAARTRRNRLIWRGRAAASAIWQTGYYCHRCGSCYFPVSPASHIPARQPMSTRQFRWIVWNAGGYAQLTQTG
ncbi:hypothetical protein [Nocardia sp. GAS34]|uniref:hypothetical protein n=1 Tax=unclassified Nocardia TaxID=2637762 RepID=UPI003D1C4DDB